MSICGSPAREDPRAGIGPRAQQAKGPREWIRVNPSIRGCPLAEPFGSRHERHCGRPTFVTKHVRCSRGRLPASGGPPSDHQELLPPSPGLRRTRRRYVCRYSPGSPDPGYKRTAFIRVDSCPSVVAPSRSHSEAVLNDTSAARRSSQNACDVAEGVYPPQAGPPRIVGNCYGPSFRRSPSLPFAFPQPSRLGAAKTRRAN